VKFDVTRVSGDLGSIAADIERAAIRAQRAAGQVVAKRGREVILEDVRSRRGSLSMMGGRLGVAVENRPSQVSTVVTLAASPAGMWAIAETGTKAHTIKPRRRKVLAISSGDVIGMYANVSGVAGKHYWTHATDALDAALFPDVKQAADAEMDKA